eukprot:6210082-Pleurochrysis_carterae.AAC.3
MATRRRRCTGRGERRARAWRACSKADQLAADQRGRNACERARGVGAEPSLDRDALIALAVDGAHGILHQHCARNGGRGVRVCERVCVVCACV